MLFDNIDRVAELMRRAKTSTGLRTTVNIILSIMLIPSIGFVTVIGSVEEKNATDGHRFTRMKVSADDPCKSALISGQKTGA